MLYSAFCTCSFIRSMALLIFTVRLEISASLALLAIGLASRSISWAMKSNFRPASERHAGKRLQAGPGGLQGRAISSEMSERSAKSATSLSRS